MIPLDDRRFTCCFCLHVRTGTILLGVGQIILHLICITVLILLAIRPDLLPNSSATLDKEHNRVFVKKTDGGNLQDSINMPPPHAIKPPVNTVVAGNEKSDSMKETSFDSLSMDDVDFDVGSGPQSDTKSRRQFSPYFALCLSTFSLAFCCFLVHGAVAHQPTHLLPFFFLQVFDFIISLLTIVGYMSSTSGVRMWLHTKDGSVYVSSMSLAFLMLSISCMVLAIKAYCLGMVWDCYKYLMLTYHTHSRGGDTWPSESRFRFLPTFWSFLGRRPSSDLFRSANQPSFETNTESTHAPPPPTVYDQTNELPNYEEALKIPANAFAPPPYFYTTTKGDAVSNRSDPTTTRSDNRDHPSA